MQTQGRNNLILITTGKENFHRPDLLSNQRCKDYVKKVLVDAGYKVKVLNLKGVDFENIPRLKGKILSLHPFCVFNLFEGFSNCPQKEAEFVLLLEELKLTFTGNSSSALRKCLDKIKAKEILKKQSIPLPRGVFVRNTKDLEKVNLDFPVFIKPCCEDASVGIDANSLVRSKENLHKVVTQKLKRFSGGLIIEEFIAGKEYNVSFLGKYPYQCLGIAVLDYSQYPKVMPFLNYSSKWDKRTKEFKVLVPSLSEKLPPVLKNKIVHLSRKAGEALGCQGYFRVDLREKDGKIYILEVNPNPDISPESGFIRQAYAQGYSYKDIITKILKEALNGRD